MNEVTYFRIAWDDGDPEVCSRCFAVVSTRWRDSHTAWHEDTDRVAVDFVPMEHGD